MNRLWMTNSRNLGRGRSQRRMMHDDRRFARASSVAWLIALSMTIVGCGNADGSPEDDAGLPQPPTPDATVMPPSDAGAHPVRDASHSGGGDAAAPAVCDVTAPTACVDPMPTYADVEPIFASRCVGCHAGEPGGSWPLNTYAHVVEWDDLIRGAMIHCSMPPPESGISMPSEERMLILNWLRCGSPR